jgi:hypothetical protein
MLPLAFRPTARVLASLAEAPSQGPSQATQPECDSLLEVTLMRRDPLTIARDIV